MRTVPKGEFCEEENCLTPVMPHSSFPGHPLRQKQKNNNSNTGLSSTSMLTHKYPSIKPSGENQESRLSALSKRMISPK